MLQAKLLSYGSINLAEGLHFSQAISDIVLQILQGRGGKGVEVTTEEL
jgi:hypothetical protein